MIAVWVPPTVTFGKTISAAAQAVRRRRHDIAAVDLDFGPSSGSAAKVEIDGGYVVARAPNGLRGGEIVFPKVTVGGTHTAIMAASLASGTTVIENAAQEPEIGDVADCLNKMGARISGAGTRRIVVEGVAKLKGARHAVLPDRTKAGTYAMAVAMAGGDVLLQNARPELFQAALDVLMQAGVTVTPTNQGIRIARNGAGLAGRRRDRAVSRVSDRSASPAHGADDARAAPRASPRPFSRTASCTCRNWRGWAPGFSSTVNAPPSKASRRSKARRHGDGPARFGLAGDRGACRRGRDHRQPRLSP